MTPSRPTTVFITETLRARLGALAKRRKLNPNAPSAIIGAVLEDFVERFEHLAPPERYCYAGSLIAYPGVRGSEVRNGKRGQLLKEGS